jgi:hypothetical protein
MPLLQAFPQSDMKIFNSECTQRVLYQRLIDDKNTINIEEILPCSTPLTCELPLT